ncbi:hypothetical protein PISMIDRAFT_640749, partial [Pisolithus microcarpus 441]
PTEDEQSQHTLLCQWTCKDFYEKFLAEGLPIELHLPTHLSMTTSLQRLQSRPLKTNRMQW